jgi:hypothetical protein
MNKLPVELQLHILAFTYLPQDKNLMNDIHSYFRFTKTTSNLFSDNNWLANDMGLFLNNNLPTLFFGYEKEYTDVLQRMYRLRKCKRSQLKKQLTRLEDRNPSIIYVKVVGGLMTCHERDSFLRQQL